MILCGYKRYGSDEKRIGKTVESLGEAHQALRTTLRTQCYKDFDSLTHKGARLQESFGEKKGPGDVQAGICGSAHLANLPEGKAKEDTNS
jgi:hypothetical protein